MNCAKQCGACSDEKTCDSCKKGSYLFKKDCIDVCPVGTYPNIKLGMCVACEDNCKICLTNDTCLICDKGHFKLNAGNDSKSICVEDCGKNYYGANGTCFKCNDSCETCANSDNCTTCKKGNVFVPATKQCPAKCPEKYYEVNGTCHDCSSNCLACKDDKDCTKCEKPFNLYYDKCIKTCPAGTYEFHGKCEKCADNCETCEVAGVCLTCKDDLYLILEAIGGVEKG